MHARLAVARRELPRAVRIAVAAGLAWWLARLLGRGPPRLRCPRAARGHSRRALRGALALARAHARRDGGVLLGIAVVALFGVSTSAIAFLLVAGLLIGLVLRTGPELNTQIAISALLLVVVTTDADTYAFERIWETALGSATTLVVAAFVLPPDPLREAQRRLTESIAALAADLADAQGTLARGDPSPRVLLSHAEEHARADARAVEDLPKALRAHPLEPPAARLAASARASSSGASGTRCGSRSRCAGWPATSRASRIATTCGRSGTRRPGASRRSSLRSPRPPPRRWPARAARSEVAERARADRRVPARGQPPRGRDPAPAARPARRRALGAARHERAPCPPARRPSSLRCACSRGGSASATTCACSRPGRLCPPIARRMPARSLGAADLLLRFSPAARARRDGERRQDHDGAPRRGDAARERRRDAELRRRARRQRLADRRARRARARRAPSGLCVAELTSNHLAVCSASPQIACITNVWPDHVDQHGSLAAYLAAKRAHRRVPGGRRLGRRERRRCGRCRAGGAAVARRAPRARSAGPADEPGAGVECGAPGRRASTGERTRPRPGRRPAAGAGPREGVLAAARALLAGATPDGIAAALAGWRGPGAAARAHRRGRRLSR